MSLRLGLAERCLSTNEKRGDGTRSAVHCQDPAPIFLAQVAETGTPTKILHLPEQTHSVWDLCGDLR